MRTLVEARSRTTRQLDVFHAAWLSDTDLLMVGRLPTKAAAAEARREAVKGQARLLLVPWRRGEAAPGSHRVVIHWRPPAELPASGSIQLAPTVDVDASSVRKRSGPLQQLVREELAWLDAGLRSSVLEFLVEAASTNGEAPATRTARDRVRFSPDRDARLSASLHALREGLRERLPVSLSSDGPMALIDGLARLDDDAYFMRGRVRAGVSVPVRVTAVSPEGSRVEILNRAYWYEPGGSRGRGEHSSWKGFVVFLTCASSARPDGWLVELETKAGEVLEVAAPRVATDTGAVIRIVLEDLGVERSPATALRAGQVVPALSRLQRTRSRAAAIEQVKQLGLSPESPSVSIVVPLYRRIDLVEHQMTQFADDPSMQSVDLIYVLDSPELEDQLMEMARRLFALYRVPFRVAVLSHNVGFAAANNLGASIARGRLLLLLNSDVFPEAPGWLDAMVMFHDSLRRPGAIGPKLVYEDDTIQHAGMFFERLGDTQPWNNEHFFKGMHRDLPAAAVSRPVAAVTGACMMIARDLYQKMDGLSGDYLQGDFEDSDLCLRLLEAGRQNWYFAGAALYHLEASSYDPEARRLHDAFNRWLHSHVWGKRLAALDGPAVARIAAMPTPKAVAVAVTGRVANGARARQ